MVIDKTMMWIRKGVFSFIIGFIITIILGVIFAVVFADATEQFSFIIGGFPLSWLRIIFGMPAYDYFAFVLDLLFWTFIVFLITTREKKEEERHIIREYFADPNRKFILITTILSILCTLMIKTITLIIGAAKFGEIHPGEVWEIGFPLPWLKVSYLIKENISDKILEVSNWLNLTVDFIIFFVLAFAVTYVVVEFRKKMK